MKKEIYKVIIVAIILIGISSFISISIYKNYNYKIDIQQTNESWTSIDNNLESIKNNMDLITESNEDFTWWRLKDFTIDDKEYQNTLNNLVSNIRMCYIGYVDNEKYPNHYNAINDFKNKSIITKKQLNKLNEDMYMETATGCLARFDGISNLLISNDETLRNRVLNEINYIVYIKNSNIFRNKEASYNELLFRKSFEVHLIKDLSDFLKEEYTRLK